MIPIAQANFQALPPPGVTVTLTRQNVSVIAPATRVAYWANEAKFVAKTYENVIRVVGELKPPLSSLWITISIVPPPPTN